MLVEIMFNVFVKLDELFKDIKFDIVFVYGDMMMMFVGSLVVFYY